jgi:hypothetical protein
MGWVHPVAGIPGYVELSAQSLMVTTTLVRLRWVPAKWTCVPHSLVEVASYPTEGRFGGRTAAVLSKITDPLGAAKAAAGRLATAIVATSADADSRLISLRMGRNVIRM